MSSLSYQQLVSSLFPRLSGGIRWGLERTRDLLRTAGDPQNEYPAVHVGGTNGKGSVAATLASVYTRSGRRTGLYSSPHLCSFRERIRIDGLPIPEQELLAAAEPLWPSLESSGASFFEATTVLAFSALARAQVDVTIAEVGLGGRLDATNVLEPRASIITNIAIDHAEYLGHTLQAIAQEKAGIIKPEVPFITAETAPDLLDLFRARCSELAAPMHVVAQPGTAAVALDGSRFTLRTRSWGELRLHTPLVGRHQIRNTALAVSALDILAESISLSSEAVEQGVASVHWPGRFEVRRANRTWLFDVAHNEAGVHALVNTFREFTWPQPIVLLVGILGDKDWSHMLPPLFQLADRVILTVPPTAPANRAWDPAAVVATVPARASTVERDLTQALERALDLSAPAGTIVVTGSFHTVGDVQALLGWSEVQPDFPLQRNVFGG